MHHRPHKPDPYKDFKSDEQRRLALRFREVCNLIARIVGVTVGAYLVSHGQVLQVMLTLANR